MALADEVEIIQRKLDRMAIAISNLNYLIRQNQFKDSVGGYRVGVPNRWLGGEMPVPEGTDILVKYRDGDTKRCSAGSEEAAVWEHSGANSDIFEFTIVEI